MYSIIIPTLLNREDLSELINNVKEATVGKYELIVTSQQVSAACNRNIGLEKAKYPIIIMIDDDIRSLPKGWNITLAEPVVEDKDGVVMTSARLLDKNGRPGMMTEFSADMNTPYVEMAYLPSACIAFRKDDTRFDEGYIGSGFEDTDFCMQLKRQYPNKKFLLNNKVKVVHLNERKNQVGSNWIRNQNFFAQKWQGKNIAISQIPEFPIEKKTISLCMIVKNEEANILRCLNSVATYVDEMVVVDTGSTDETMKIIQDHYPNAKIVCHEWADDFGGARNIAVQYATKDWVLFMDADEEIAHFDSTAVQYAMNAPSSVPYVYMVAFKNSVETGVVNHFMTRFFPRLDILRYQGRIHERLVTTDHSDIHTCRTYDIQILHHGYTQDMMDSREKGQRNIRLLTKCREDEPYSPYWAYHLGITYKSIGDIKKAVDTFVIWRDLVDQKPDATMDYSIGYSAYIGCLLADKQITRIITEAPKYDSKNHHNPDWNFNYAVALDQAGEVYKAYEVITRNEKLKGTRIAVSSYDGDTVGWKLYAVKGTLLSKLGRPVEAKECWQSAYHLNPSDLSVLSSLISATVAARDFVEAEKLIGTYMELIGNSPISEVVARAHADVLYNTGRIEDAIAIFQHFPNFDTILRNVEYNLLSNCRYNDLYRIHNVLKKAKKTNVKP